MDRRDAMKALGTLAASAGITIVPVTTKDAVDVQLVILKVPERIGMETSYRLREAWEKAVRGTSLQDVQTLVMENGMDIEIVHGNG